MKRQLGEGEEPKIEVKSTADVGFEPWSLWARAIENGDIDPADFIDPKDLRYRRKPKSSGR
jgi:hypothetical protein